MNAEVNHSCDGLIVSVNGIEKKIKYRNSAELYWDGVSYTDGLNVKYAYFVKPEFPGVYECFDNSYVITGCKPRHDRRLPQASAIFSFDAPTVDDFKFLINQYDPVWDAYVDCLPLNDACILIRDVFSDRKIASMTIPVVKSILDAKCVRSSAANIVSHLNETRVGNCFRVTDTTFSRLKPRSKEATRLEIYERIQATRLTLPPYEMAHALSQLGMIVSVRKIRLMVYDRQLCTLGESVFVRRNAKMKRLKRFEKYEPIFDAYSGVVKYSNNNRASKYAIDDVVKGLVSEMDELYSEIKLDEKALSETGDVIVMIFRVMDILYPSFRIMENSVFKDKVFKHRLLEVFSRKVEERLKMYGCVRNHDTSPGHKCVCGFNFRVLDDKKREIESRLQLWMRSKK